MALYDHLRTLVIPLNVHKSRITSAFGLIGGQTTAGPGNEGVNAAVWIQERIDDGTIIAGSPTIQEEGNPLPASDTINFVGAGATVTDVAGVTTVTIPGGGSGAGISEVEVGTTLIRYIILTGTPVFTANIASGVQTITATGGTYKLVSVATTGATANLAGDNSFTIIYNGFPGTTLIAYPSIDKWNLSGSAPSSGVPDIHSLAASPQHQLIGAVPGTSVTIRLINMNTYTNWCIKSIW